MDYEALSNEYVLHGVRREKSLIFERAEVLSLTGAFHGMSLATMGLTGMPALRNWLPGAVRWPTFRQIPSADAYRPPLGEGTENWRAAVHALEADLDGASSGQVAAL